MRFSWSALAEENFGRYVRLAERGNVDAAQRLAWKAGHLLQHDSHDQPLPICVCEWLAPRLAATARDPARTRRALGICFGRGRPSAPAVDAVSRGQQGLEACAACLHGGRPLPVPLRDLLGRVLKATFDDRRRLRALGIAPANGRPVDHRDDMHAAMLSEAEKDRWAWMVLRLSHMPCLAYTRTL